MIYVADSACSRCSARTTSVQKCPRTQRQSERERKKEEIHVLTQTMSIKMAKMCRAECVWIY